jgi:hypothetical protein
MCPGARQLGAKGGLKLRDDGAVQHVPDIFARFRVEPTRVARIEGLPGQPRYASDYRTPFGAFRDPQNWRIALDADNPREPRVRIHARCSERLLKWHEPVRGSFQLKTGVRTLLTTIGALVAGIARTLINFGARPSVVLQPGDEAPLFELPGSDGRIYRLRDLRGRAVVLAWFPKAFTGG